MFNFIKTIPTTIIDFLKEFFIPEKDVLTNEFISIKDAFTAKYPTADLKFMEDLTNTQSAQLRSTSIDSITVGDVTIGINTSFILNKFYSIWGNYKTTFQSWISGFMYLLLGIYNYNQLLYALRGTTPIYGTQMSDSKQPQKK